MKKTEVFIVEDEILIARDLQNNLEEMGYIVSIFPSGEQAIQMIKEKRPDIILMDIVLQSKMDGVETSKIISSNFNIPIIYLTAHGEDTIFEKAKKTEPFGFLIKRFRKEELQKTIEISLYKHIAEEKRKKLIHDLKREIIERKNVEEKLVVYQTRLKRLSSALSLAEERERRHISEGLHDRIGQSLTVIKMKLEELQEPQTDTDTGRVLNETWELLDKTIKDLRTLTFEISPPILYELGFEQAVEWLVEQFREQHNISIDFVSNGLNLKLNEDISFFLFKAVRELLFNIIKHARANRIKVLALKENNKIRINIEDDGVGFNASKVKFSVNELNGFGLFSIRERMEHFGGQFDVKSKSGRGTRITLVMPLTQQKGAAGAKR